MIWQLRKNIIAIYTVKWCSAIHGGYGRLSGKQEKARATLRDLFKKCITYSQMNTKSKAQDLQASEI